MSSGNKAHPAPVPADAESVLPGYDFADAFVLPAPEGLDAIEATRRAFASPPPWAAMLMRLRDGVVAPFGLKPAPPTGFPVIAQSPERVILGFDDKHLDFRIVVTVAGGQAILATLVRQHNFWGRLYLAAILPFHRRIVPAFLERVG